MPEFCIFGLWIVGLYIMKLHNSKKKKKKKNKKKKKKKKKKKNAISLVIRF